MAATHRRVAGTGVILAVLFALASPAHAAFPGQNGKLAFLAADAAMRKLA